jgi:hypothetical protein
MISWTQSSGNRAEMKEVPRLRVGMEHQPVLQQKPIGPEEFFAKRRYFSD